jgi:hypothetical protein
VDMQMTNRIGVRLLVDGRAETHPLDEFELLIARQDGLVWVDIPNCDDEGVRVLSEVFGFHPLAVRDCVERNHLPKFHAYSDHVFIVLQALERDDGGRVHTIELDQFAGPGFLVTVHEPPEPGSEAADGLRQTRTVLRRIEAGRLDPGSSFEVSHAIASALTQHQETLVGELTREAWQLEQRVMLEELPDPEQFLEQLFQARQELLRVRTTHGQAEPGDLRPDGDAVPLRARRLSAPASRHRRPVRAARRRGRRPEGVSRGRDRVLPDPNRNQNDHRCGATGGHRGGHPADHRAVVDLRDEPHR